MSHLFHTPAVIATGAGCRREVGTHVAAMGVRRALVVTDAFLTTTGVVGELLDTLEKAGVAAAVFSDVQPDPTDTNVRAGVAAYVDANAECLIAIGGGSPIDTAKVISASLANPGPLEQFQGYHRLAAAGPPVVAIPTTAGTGSEATKAAVITDTARHVKMMMFDAKLMPRLAFVDYELSMTMPPALTAYVGVDTLTHGIEAYVSRKANALSDPLALSCIRLASRWLRTAWAEPGHREAREAMATAALHGGMAFGNASVALVHGMSRPLGAVFHLAHGLSNAVLLPAVTRFSLEAAPERYRTVAETMGVTDLVDALARLNEDLRVPTLGGCLKGNRAALDAAARKMAEDALASGSPANNPRVPTVEEILALYDEAW